MRNWTRRDWVVVLVLIAGGLVGSRLFPEFWDNVVVSIAAVAFFRMIIVGTWRGQRQARKKEALKEARRQRFRKSGPEDG